MEENEVLHQKQKGTGNALNEVNVPEFEYFELEETKEFLCEILFKIGNEGLNSVLLALVDRLRIGHVIRDMARKSYYHYLIYNINARDTNLSLSEIRNCQNDLELLNLFFQKGFTKAVFHYYGSRSQLVEWASEEVKLLSPNIRKCMVAYIRIKEKHDDSSIHECFVDDTEQIINMIKELLDADVLVGKIDYEVIKLVNKSLYVPNETVLDRIFDDEDIDENNFDKNDYDEEIWADKEFRDVGVLFHFDLNSFLLNRMKNQNENGKL